MKKDPSEESIAWVISVWYEKRKNLEDMSESPFFQKVLRGTQSINANWMKSGIKNLKKLNFLNCPASGLKVKNVRQLQRCLWKTTIHYSKISCLCSWQMDLSLKAPEYKTSKFLFHFCQTFDDTLNKVITSLALISVGWKFTISM